MNKFLKYSLRLYLGIAMSSVFWACTSGDMSIDFDLNQPENNSVVFIDTMKIQTSVLKTDSISTSATGSMLVGAFYEGTFGSTRSESYFQIALPSQNINGLALNEKEIYDSVALVLDYSGYTGDTTQQQVISAYQLKSIPLTSRTYYNTSSLASESTPLGSTTFRARPTKDSTLNIRFSDDFGLKLFEVLNGTATFEMDEVTRRVKGLVVKPGESNVTSLLNFSVTGSSVRVYTHSEKTLTKHTFDFAAITNAVQFNHLTYSSIFEPVNQLKKPLTQVSTDLSNKQGLIKAGVGLYTKFNIPGIRQLTEINKFRNVSRVEMRVYALHKNVKESLNVPQSLSLLKLNLSNQIEGAVYNVAGGAVTGAYTYDASALTFTSFYTFDLTQYYNDIITGKEANKGFLLTVPSGSDTGNTTSSVMIGAQNHPTLPIEIKVYYTTN